MQAAGERPELLFIDDDPLIVETLSLALRDQFMVHSAGGRQQARELLHRLGASPSLALVDLGLPPVPHDPREGFVLIDELLAFNPSMKILVLSSQSDRHNIQHALALGAVDFVPKPCDVPLLRTRLAHQLMMLAAEQASSREHAEDHILLGNSAAITTLQALIAQFADSPFPVLVQGASGSGKELVARGLHVQSMRAKRPFLSINCAAFPKELLDAQLFGHAKGAFTGALQNRSGFFEDAEDGTLFLDEIGEMPLELQSKLLRVLENGEFYRLGETQTRTSRARIVAATNRELREELRAGRFRQDLYHRLCVLTINMPPLQERERDSLLLLDHFRSIYAPARSAFTLTPDAEQLLLDYPFPGNVRELRNIVIRLGAKYPGRAVGAAELVAEMDTGVGAPPGGAALDEDALRAELAAGRFDLHAHLEGQERRYIETALALSGGNLSKAARLLGLNRTTLYSRIQRLSIPIPELAGR